MQSLRTEIARPQIGVDLREVPAYWRCCLAEIRLQYSFLIVIYLKLCEEFVTFIIYCGFLNFVLDHHLILFSSIIT